MSQLLQRPMVISKVTETRLELREPGHRDMWGPLPLEFVISQTEATRLGSRVGKTVWVIISEG